jgi:hypothetical protein
VTCPTLIRAHIVGVIEIASDVLGGVGKTLAIYVSAVRTPTHQVWGVKGYLLLV